jgi:hypothetical protein
MPKNKTSNAILLIFKFFCFGSGYICTKLKRFLLYQYFLKLHQYKIHFSLLCFLILSTVLVAAQEAGHGFRKQISFRHDNDAFAFQGTDGYYTSGIFINYSVVRKKNDQGVIKTIDNVEVAQKVFTQRIRQVFAITELDRPVTGYLSVEVSRTQYKTRNRFTRVGLSAGTVGPLSLGKELLDVIHPILQINPRSWSWIFGYGIKTEVGINAHGTYGFSVFPESYAGFLQVTPVSNVTLGTSFTNIRQSVLLQLGRQNRISESGFWNSRVKNDETSVKYKRELFAFYQPELTYQIYNATIQGGMFRSDKGRVVAKNKPIVAINKFGVMYATPRYSLDVHLTFHSKEAKLQEASHLFGGVRFAYRYK